MGVGLVVREGAATIDVERGSDIAIIRATGELDLSARDTLVDAVAEALRDPIPALLVLDMRQVTYMDTTALQYGIVYPYETAQDDDIATVIRASTPVRRTLQMAGLADWLSD